MSENCILSKQIRRESWSNLPPQSGACVGFLYKVVRKIGRFPKFILARGNEFQSVRAWNIHIKLGTLAHYAHGYKMKGATTKNSENSLKGYCLKIGSIFNTVCFLGLPLKLENCANKLCFLTKNATVFPL